MYFFDLLNQINYKGYTPRTKDYKDKHMFLKLSPSCHNVTALICDELTEKKILNLKEKSQTCDKKKILYIIPHRTA